MCTNRFTSHRLVGMNLANYSPANDTAPAEMRARHWWYHEHDQKATDKLDYTELCASSHLVVSFFFSFPFDFPFFLLLLLLLYLFPSVLSTFPIINNVPLTLGRDSRCQLGTTTNVRFSTLWKTRRSCESIEPKRYASIGFCWRMKASARHSLTRLTHVIL